MRLHTTNRSGRFAGLTLVEVVVSVTILTIALGAIYALNSQCISVMRAKRNMGASSLLIQERVEAFRMAEWGTVTTSVGVNELLSKQTNSLAFGFMGMDQPTERVTVTAYDPLTGTTSGPAIVGTCINGSVVVPPGINISATDTVRLDFEFSWSEMGRVIGPKRLSTTLGSFGFCRTAISRKPYEPKAPNS